MTDSGGRVLGPAVLREAPALVLLAIVAAVQLFPLAGPGRLPENLDLMLQYVPNAAYLARGLAEGRVPLWNPFLGAGMPFAADPGAGAWYLPNWPLLRALPLYAAVRAALWLHLLWATLGSYTFCRALLRVPPLAAALGAAAFALTTWLPGLSGMPVVLTSVSWLPWILTLGALAAARGGRWIALLAVAGALQALSGWPAGAYLAWLALGAFTLFSGYGWRAFARVASAGVVAAILASVLLVPAAEFVRETSYAETRPIEQVARDGYLTLLSWLRPASGTGSLESSQLYTGIATILLALVAPFEWRRPSVRALIALAVLALLVSWGTHGPLFALLHRFLPGFRIVFLPARLGVLAAFALSALAAVGLARLTSTGLSRRQAWFGAAALAGLVPLVLGQFWLSEGYDNFRRLLTNVGRWTGGPFLSVPQEAQFVGAGLAALALLALSAMRRWRAIAPAWLALVLADVIAAHQLARPPAFDPQRWYAPAIEAADGLRATLGADRVVGYQWHGEEHFLNRFPQSANPALLPPNLALLAGIRDAQGYNPLLLRRAATYFAAVNAAGTGAAAPDDHWLWLEQPLADPVPGLAVRRVLVDPASEWRVRSLRLPLATPLSVSAAGAPARVALSAPFEARDPGRLHVVTYLGQGTDLPQRTAVAVIRLQGTAGEWTAQLRAGEHTSEWAYERPDVRPRVRHAQAPIALRTQLVDPVGGRFFVFEYRATFDLPALGSIESVEVTPLLPPGPATLHVSGLWREAHLNPDGAVLEAGQLRLGPSRGRVSAARGQVRIMRDDPGLIEMNVQSPGGTPVLLADTFYPGWVARIGGDVLPIRPESPIQDERDALFRAVNVPAGDHILTMSYEPASLRIGLALTGAGVLACLWLLVRPPGALTARDRRPTPPPSTPTRVPR